MFIVAQITIRIWNQAGCPATEEWGRKLRLVHTLMLYAITLNTETWTFVVEWMIFMLSNINPI